MLCDGHILAQRYSGWEANLDKGTDMFECEVNSSRCRERGHYLSDVLPAEA